MNRFLITKPLSKLRDSFLDPSKRVSLKTVFSIDLRSLALMRIMLSLLILLDLALRVPQIKLFYTDAGILPKDKWAETISPWHLSLHAASGELWWQILLFIVAAVFAIGLFIGYRTRLMTILSWVMLMSICNRNELILQGGDILLLVMSFWAIFLPLGAKWSVDAALQPEYLRNPNQRRFEAEQPQLYFSMATVAVIFQVLFLYFFTALLKTGEPWRFPFEATQYTLEIQHFATPIGMWFKGLTPILPLSTAYVLFVEFFAPLLILLPFLWPITRIVGLLLLASLHFAFMLLMHIGLFPLIDFMSLSLLIPSLVWIALAKRKQRSKAAQVTMYYDEDCGFCLKMCLILREWLLPETVKILPAQSYSAIHAIMEQENSWVIADAKGKTHTHWHAMAFLFTQNWATKPLGWLLMFPPFMWMGNRVYRWVANNRNFMASVTSTVLPARPLKLRPTRIGQVAALYVFVVVVIYNVSGLPDMGKYRHEIVSVSARVLRIDQRWSMFAPKPLSVSIFPQVGGTLRNGENVNLYELTDADPEWIAPDYMYPLYDGYRMRKYYDRLRSKRYKVARAAFGHYQCSQWNSKATARSEQLGILELNYVHLKTNLNNEPKKRSRHLAWRHWCYPEFKPKS